MLFTRPALYAIAALIVAGLGAFVYLIVGRYGTPFVVAHADRARRAHLPARALRGRGRARDRARAGDGVVRAPDPARRLQARGDLPLRVRGHLGGVVRAAQAGGSRSARPGRSPTSRSAAIFSILCVVVEGTTRDVFFQLAFAGYVGAFFNLNPFIDRDGYHILVDYLREPGLRKRAKDQFSRRLTRQGPRAPTRRCSRATRLRASVGRYWRQALPSSCHCVMQPIMSAFAPSYVVWAVLGTLWVALFIPVFVVAREAAGGARARPGRRDLSRGRRLEADVAAQLIERLLVDPAFRARFRRNPAEACREAGLEELAQEMQLGAGKAMMTLDMRESKSSLAGVMMAAAMEGVGIMQFAEHVAPHLDDIPEAIGDVLSRVNLPAIGGASAAPRRRRPRRRSRRRRRRRANGADAIAARRSTRAPPAATAPRRPPRPRPRRAGDAAPPPRAPEAAAAADAKGGAAAAAADRGRGEAEERRRRGGRQDRRGRSRRTPRPRRRRRRRSPRSRRTRRTSRARPTCRTSRACRRRPSTSAIRSAAGAPAAAPATRPPPAAASPRRSGRRRRPAAAAAPTAPPPEPHRPRSGTSAADLADQPAGGGAKHHAVDPSQFGQDGHGGTLSPEGAELLKNKNVVLRRQRRSPTSRHGRIDPRVIAAADQDLRAPQDQDHLHVLGPPEVHDRRLGLQPRLRPRARHRVGRRRDRQPRLGRARASWRASCRSCRSSTGRTRSARRGRSAGPATSPTARTRTTCTSGSRRRSTRAGRRPATSPPRAASPAAPPPRPWLRSLPPPSPPRPPWPARPGRRAAGRRRSRAAPPPEPEGRRRPASSWPSPRTPADAGEGRLRHVHGRPAAGRPAERGRPARLGAGHGRRRGRRRARLGRQQRRRRRAPGRADPARRARAGRQHRRSRSTSTSRPRKVGPGNPWCASFVTWSLEQSGHKMNGSGWAAVPPGSSTPRRSRQPAGRQRRPGPPGRHRRLRLGPREGLRLRRPHRLPRQQRQGRQLHRARGQQPATRS